MDKLWYQEPGEGSDVTAACRIRLFRNRADLKFPWKLTAEECGHATDEMLQALSEKVPELSDAGAFRMEQMEEEKLRTLYEKAILHKGSLQHPDGAGILISKDESISVTINSEDHIRMQVSHTGREFRKVWSIINALDDAINQIYPYAFDDVLGYRTAYPTNVGTGMKAYAVLHLPQLAESAGFSELPGEIGRYGVSIRPAFGTAREESGDLFVLFNQKTLGISELDIIQILDNVIGRLTEREKKLRQEAAGRHRLQMQDVCCKAYGTLRYAQLMSQKTAMQLLSHLWWGTAEGLVAFRTEPDFYRMMMEIQPGTLQEMAGRRLEGVDCDRERALYLRKRLPELTEE